MTKDLILGFLIGIMSGLLLDFAYDAWKWQIKELIDLRRWARGREDGRDTVIEPGDEPKPQTPEQRAAEQEYMDEVAAEKQAERPDSQNLSEEAAKKAEISLEDRRREVVRLQQLSPAESAGVDVYTQIGDAQREYGEEYYRIHKRVPPEWT